MVNGFRYYTALESVNITSALSTELTIYPCQIRVHQYRSTVIRYLRRLNLQTQTNRPEQTNRGNW